MKLDASYHLKTWVGPVILAATEQIAKDNCQRGRAAFGPVGIEALSLINKIFPGSRVEQIRLPSRSLRGSGWVT